MLFSGGRVCCCVTGNKGSIGFTPLLVPFCSSFDPGYIRVNTDPCQRRGCANRGVGITIVGVFAAKQ